MRTTASLCLACLMLPATAAEIPSSVVDRAVELRRTIHANPELSNREHETGALVAAELRDLGFEVHEGIAITGVVGILEGGSPGPVVAVRADMDALPVLEDTGLPFASTVTGEYLGETVPVAHACGHDIHVAVGLGTARALAERREDLAGTVMFIFQPAEEGAPLGEEGGATRMIAEGLFDIATPTAIFALHSWPDQEVGEVAVTSGPSYASSAQFLIDVKGEQAHGAWPHLSVDPVVTAAEIVTALQTIRSRSLEPTEAGVVSVGIIEGGERNNIIPSQVHLEGTVRTYSTEVEDLIERRMRAIVEGVTAAHGADFEMEFVRQNPPTVNDPELAAWARARLIERMGPDAVLDSAPVMGAEDFAHYLDTAPGFYFRLGVTEPGTENGALHTPTMRADDGAVEVGIRAMTGLVLDFLAEGPV